MIFDTISNYKKYESPELSVALNALAQLDVHTPVGVITISDEVVIKVMEYETDAVEDVLFEMHQDHIDVHYLLKGSEIAQIADPTDAPIINYDTVDDVGEYEALVGNVTLAVSAGQFYVTMEKRPHKPACHMGGGKQMVKKALAKVLVK